MNTGSQGRRRGPDLSPIAVVPKVFISYSTRAPAAPLRSRITRAIESRIKYKPLDYRTKSWDASSSTAINCSLDNLKECTAAVCLVSDEYLASRTCMLEATYCAFLRRRQPLLAEHSPGQSDNARRLGRLLRRIQHLRDCCEEQAADLREQLVEKARLLAANEGLAFLELCEREVAALESITGVQEIKEGVNYHGSAESAWYEDPPIDNVLGGIQSQFFIYHEARGEQPQDLLQILAEYYPVNPINVGPNAHTLYPTTGHIPMLLTSDRFLDRFHTAFPLVACAGRSPFQKVRPPVWHATRNHGVVEYRDWLNNPKMKLLNLGDDSLKTILKRIREAFEEALRQARAVQELEHQSYPMP